jgi:hypothetical protein
MFRGKKWEIYWRKQHRTLEEVHARRRAASIKGHKTRRAMLRLRRHKLAEDAGEAISLELSNLYHMKHTSVLLENK